MTVYAGTGSPGRVYRYGGGTNWTLISGDLDEVVLCLHSHGGSLYAGTSTGTGGGGIGKVYRYDGGTTWTQVGGDLDQQAASLVTYGGDLIVGTVGTFGDGMKTYRLDGDNWVLRQNHGGDTRGTRAMAVIDGNLYEGDYYYDIIARNGSLVLDPNVSGVWGSCIWDFAQHGGVIYAGAYDGRYWYSSDGIIWSDYRGAPFTGHAYPGDMIWAVDSFNGDIYFGCKALYKTTSHTHVWTAPGDRRSCILALLSDSNTMYIGVGNELGYESQTPDSGYVYSYTGSGSPTLISGALGHGVQVLCFHVEAGWNIWVHKSGVWEPVTDIWVYKNGVWESVSAVDVYKEGWEKV